MGPREGEWLVGSGSRGRCVSGPQKALEGSPRKKGHLAYTLYCGVSGRCLPTCLPAAKNNRKWERTRFCSESTQLTALAGLLKGASLLSSKASPHSALTLSHLVQDAFRSPHSGAHTPPSVRRRKALPGEQGADREN